MTSTSIQYPVDTVDEAYNACHPEIPLEHGDPRYVDLNPVRGGFDLATRVTRRIRRTPYPLFHKQLITGHRGCGKSTELKQLKDKLTEEEYFAVYLDIEDVLDLGDIHYLDVLLSLARAVYEQLYDEGIRLPDDLIDRVDDWFATTILTEEQRENVETTLKSEFSVKAEVPMLMRFLVGVTGLIRAGGSRRTEVRRELEREIRVFLDSLNELLDEAHKRLFDKGWKGLVVIVDGLEKMHFRVIGEGQTSHSMLFAMNAELLKTPRCHIVYTVPVSLVFNVNLGDAFPDTDFIPMVKISNRYGSVDADGRKAMYDVVANRANVSTVFECADAVNNLVEASGGSVRDLLRMVRFAFDEADDCVTVDHSESAVRRLIREYDFLLKDEHKGALAQIATNLRISGDEVSSLLLHHRLVLEYQNHERWHDLHPVVRSNARVQEWLAPASSPPAGED